VDAAEKQILLDQLHRSHELVHTLAAGLTESQWEFRESPGRWSIAECIEHITTVETRTLSRIERKLTEPPEPEKRHLTVGKDQLIPAVIPLRATRVQAPEPVRPVGRWKTPELLSQFREARERTIYFVNGSSHNLRDHIFAHVAMGEIDCYQWLLFLGSHSERHARQIEEIKSHPEYPAQS